MKRFILLCIMISLLVLSGCQGDLSCNETVDIGTQNTDQWGISICAEDVTPKGMTLKIMQSGGNPSGNLETGVGYSLTMHSDGEWQPVETKAPVIWTLVAYDIKKNDITEMKVDWQNTYGTLKPGDYCLKKEIMDFRAAGDYDTETYEVYFTIES